MKKIALLTLLLINLSLSFSLPRNQASPAIFSVTKTNNSILFRHTDSTLTAIPCQSVASIVSNADPSKIVSVWVVQQGDYDKIMQFDYLVCGFSSKSDAVDSLTAWAICDTSSGGGGGGGDVTQSALDDTSSALNSRISAKQNTLVSGTNIKTINSTTLLGSGNLPINVGVVYRTDSIRLYVIGGTDTIVFGYAVRGLTYASDTLSWYEGGTRYAEYIGGGGGGGYLTFNDSLGTPINDTTRTAFRGGNLVVNGIMMGRGRLNIANNTAFGSQALSLSNTDNSYLSAFGFQALARQTTGAYNNAFGYLALNQNIINSYLNAFGTEALYNTKANNNSGFGYRAGFSNITGVSNAYFGNGAGYAGLASYNSFFGDGSGTNYTGSYATGCGQASLFTATSGSQTAIGANSLYSTTGADNVGVGFQSGQGLTSGTNNFLGGKQSGFSLGLGSNNTMIGYYSGNVATGSSNTFYGSTSGQSITNGAKNTYIGRYTGSSHTTRSKLIILSDGDGTIGMFIDSVQRVGIGNVVPTANLSVQGSATISTSTPSAPSVSAVLEVQSTTQGFRIVPMTATQASAITAVEGLMLFVSDTNGTFTSIGLWCYENGAWSKK